jgi:hypothetical protein
MTTNQLTPEEFAQSFLKLFTTSVKEEGAEVGIHWSRPEETGKSDEHERDTEWTAIMAIFLSRLARRNKCYQKWELRAGKKRIDYGWYGEDDPRSLIAIIEHENNVVKAKEEELPKLINYKCGLKVLITYEWTINKPETIRGDVEPVLKQNAGMKGEFLLVVGTKKLETQEPEMPEGAWQFYRWNNQVMEDITDELDH